MPSQPLLHFGLEIELLLRPREELADLEGGGAAAHDSVLAMQIVQRHNAWFNQTGDKKMHSAVHMDKREALALAELGYTQWKWMTDPTLEVEDEYHSRKCCPASCDTVPRPARDLRLPCSTDALELVSPIMEFDDSGEWRNHVRKAFWSVEAVADIETNRTCATQIHISPGCGASWQAEEVAQICMCIVYFERAFLALLPEARRISDQCKSNTAGTVLGGQSSDEC